MPSDLKSTVNEALNGITGSNPLQIAVRNQPVCFSPACLVASILLLHAVWYAPVVRAEQSPRLARAYQDSTHFVVRPAQTSISAGPFTIRQAAYAGDVVRPDDTVGAKLARILSLASISDNAREIEIVIFDQSQPGAMYRPAPASKARRICVLVPLPGNDSTGVIEKTLQQNSCQNGDAGYITTRSLQDPALAGRTRLTENQLNEIGHRLAAEEIFSQLLAIHDIAAVVTPPPLYKMRINIHPEKNERLASGVISDS